MYLQTVCVLIITGYVKAEYSFIKPCSVSAPNLNECALKSANEVLPILKKGYKAFKIPNLIPVLVSEVAIDSPNLQMRFTDVSSDVLFDATITKMNIDDKAKKWSYTLETDVSSILGNYDIKGQILVLSISGQGPANVTYIKPAYTYKLSYKEVEKNGDKYLEFVSSEGKYDCERTYYKFDNLFNGNKKLGDEMNVFLNENWEVLDKEFNPVIVKTLTGIMDNAIKNIFARVPKSEIFLP